MRNFENIFAAYMIGWAAFFVYQVSISQRLKKAEDDVKRLKGSGSKS